MNFIEIISWFNVSLSILGNILVIKKKRSGFMAWIISNIIWIVIDFNAGIYSQVALFIVFTIIAIYGFIKWRE